ncbi:hypothetical protein H0A65_17405 [Alcaligenaceae bacterium]|nr:hypothetical protein [Alcaligenaceae bacterium]
MNNLIKDVPVRPPSSAVRLRQMSMRFDSNELLGMSAMQRARVITHLAHLLMQAASDATGKEHDDDER